MKAKSFLKFLVISLSILFYLDGFCQTDTPISDATITAKVKSKILADSSTSVFKIAVTTDKGVVSLAGKVKSDSQAADLIEIAQSTDGVANVDASKLVVETSKQPMDDVLITGKIKGLFMREKLFGDKPIAAMTIHVETNNGAVFLTGTADNQAQADTASALAKSVYGVKNVTSTVKINKTS